MKKLVPIGSPALPALVAVAGERASMRFLEFFAANIRNPHTRRACYRAAQEFLAWCASAGVPSIGAVQPVHVATWIEAATRELAAPSVKQRLAAIRHLFDWLVTGQVVPVNPAGSVRGPRHVVTSGQTPVLDPSEARAARQYRYRDTCGPARPRADRAHGVFLRPDRRRARHGDRRCLYAKPPAMGAPARERRQAARDAVPPQPRGISHRRRAAAAGIATRLGNHSFRATGITAYLKNGGTLEQAAAMANYASTRNDRRRDEVSLDEVERIVI
jgi:Phage integrase, N-terminal SAM-like domain